MPTASKGQFFILGALLILSLMVIGASYQPLTNPRPLAAASDNLQRELPRAYNLGLTQGNGPGALADFTAFLQDGLGSRSISMQAAWLAAMPGNGEVNFVVGNFLGKPVDFSLNAAGQSWSGRLEDKATFSAELATLADVLAINLTVNGREQQLEWRADKANIYAFYALLADQGNIYGEVSG
ncbi:MAG: hypothetical protein HY519_02820 [Candidatus Aenigmarchaeota archaeon]|nr:hypothetical protein [Candidatus Aenigmarchaeota archaeon]